MGNPHTLEDWELAYMAGLIDGEGTITLERTGKRRLAGVMGLSPKVLVANTNEALIEHAVQQFRRLGANPHIKSQEVGYGRRPRRRMCFWVTAQGLAKLRRMLPPLVPFLIAKKAQAQLILEFIELRGDPLQAKGKPYGSQEMRILDQIRVLNHRGVSETEDHGLRQANA